MAAVLEVADVVQEYPGVRALAGVSLELSSGQVLGLVGENGAGKSTLIRILGGIERAVSGVVSVHGSERHFRSSAESQAAGISVVSQEFRLVPQLSVADNIFLGHELVTGGVVQRARTHERSAELLEQLGMDLDPDRPVSSLTVGDRQMVEIARALSREFDILVMDEPTAALNGAEISQLHTIVRRLADQGKAVIYVSHHLEEIFAVCGDVAVLRDGSLVAHQPTSELDEKSLVEHMLGRKPQTFERGEQATGGADVRLDVRDLEVPGIPGRVDLQVRRGEILGLAGLVGSGRERDHPGAVRRPRRPRRHGRRRRSPRAASQHPAGGAQRGVHALRGPQGRRHSRPPGRDRERDGLAGSSDPAVAQPPAADPP